jgi:hypothetical protein
MRWLWFVAAIVCLMIVFKTHSVGLAVVCLLGTLGFLLAGMVAVVSGRIEGRSQDVSSLMGPDEIRRMRELEQRKREAATEADAKRDAGPGSGASPSGD